MKTVSLAIIASLLLPLSAEARPSLRGLQEQSKQQTEQSAATRGSQSLEDIKFQWKPLNMAHLNFNFEFPGNWQVDVDNAIPDYLLLTQVVYPDSAALVVERDGLADVFNDLLPNSFDLESFMRGELHEPKAYEHSNSLTTRTSLEVLEQKETTFLGYPAAFADYRSTEYSVASRTQIMAIAHPNGFYAIRYRAEEETFENWLPVFERALETFVFIGSDVSSSSSSSSFSSARSNKAQNGENSPVFSDVPLTHPRAAAIAKLKSQGIVGGYPDGSFKPDATLNRAEFVKILTSEVLTSAQELEKCVDKNPFGDADMRSWYAAHLCVARARKMIGGYPDGSFRPGKEILVAEAAKIIVTFFFGEQAASNPWHAVYMDKLRAEGALPASVTDPAAPLTRGEMAEMLGVLID